MSNPITGLSGSRVEVPTHTETWMRGDRFGTIVGIGPGSSGFGRNPRKATVLLDKSGRKAKFPIEDLRIIEPDN